jgi:tetratricopeptide (TPR) repeat protein
VQVFLSYRRGHARWVATAVRQALQARDVDVFMDVDSIDSGRFDSVILNEIGLREHFVVLLTLETIEDLGRADDWVTRELDRALELGKNVVPVLVDRADLASVPDRFPRRMTLIGLNALRLPHDLFEPAMAVLVERFLTQPRLQELQTRTAEEFYEAAADAIDREDWEEAVRRFEAAIALRNRAEYFLGRAEAEHRLGRVAEALSDYDAALALDPFAIEVMQAKFDCLQAVGRLQDALRLVTDWRRHAEERATAFAGRIVGRLDQGDDIATAAGSVAELTALYSHLGGYEQVGAVLATLVEHVRGPLGERLQEELRDWKSSGDRSLEAKQAPG